MTENELAAIVTDTAFQIHVKLGPGLLESVYEKILAHELIKRGLKAQMQVPVGLTWDNLSFDVAFRADLIVETRLLVELKSIDELASVHKKQVLTYLKLTDLRLGLLLNFGSALMKDGIVRVVNGLSE